MDKIFRLQFIFMGGYEANMKRLAILKHRWWKNGRLITFSFYVYLKYFILILKGRKGETKVFHYFLLTPKPSCP